MRGIFRQSGSYRYVTNMTNKNTTRRKSGKQKVTGLGKEKPKHPLSTEIERRWQTVWLAWRLAWVTGDWKTMLLVLPLCGMSTSSLFCLCLGLFLSFSLLLFHSLPTYLSFILFPSSRWQRCTALVQSLHGT